MYALTNCCVNGISNFEYWNWNFYLIQKISKSDRNFESKIAEVPGLNMWIAGAAPSNAQMEWRKYAVKTFYLARRQECVPSLPLHLLFSRAIVHHFDFVSFRFLLWTICGERNFYIAVFIYEYTHDKRTKDHSRYKN